MPGKVCGERITRKSRDGTKELTPMLSYTCELDAGHEGPHASPSDLHSVNERKAWEDQNARDEELKRHQESGLGMTQSLPMPSASIIEGDITDPQRKVGRPHPSEPTKCPFCPESPMHKDFIDHVKTHQGDPDVRERRDERRAASAAVREKLPSPPPQKPPMAPRGTPGAAPEPNQGITTIEDSREVVGESEPFPIDLGDEVAAGQALSVDEPTGWYSYGMSLAVAIAAIDAHFKETLTAGGSTEVVRNAWEIIKDSLENRTV